MARLTDRPPTPPPGSPFLPSAPRPQRAPAAREHQQRAAAGMILMGLSLLAVLWGATPQRTVYVVAVALIVTVAGLGLVISAMRAARRARTRRPIGSVVGVVIGGLLALFMAGALTSYLMYPTQFTRYGNCMNAATTSAEQHACLTQLENSIGVNFPMIGK